MPTVDKISIRNEIGRLKDDFDKLCSEGKITGEIRVLMNSMLLILNLMLSIFLEKKTKKNSDNSSIPPSQAEENDSSLGKEGSKRGKLAKSDAHNLLERFQNHETAVLLFANHSHVSFTNNRAERDLRMAKVKQKVSGCLKRIIRKSVLPDIKLSSDHGK